MRRHAGQLSFPGGRIEPGEDAARGRAARGARGDRPRPEPRRRARAALRDARAPVGVPLDAMGGVRAISLPLRRGPAGGGRDPPRPAVGAPAAGRAPGRAAGGVRDEPRRALLRARRRTCSGARPPGSPGSCSASGEPHDDEDLPGDHGGRLRHPLLAALAQGPPEAVPAARRATSRSSRRPSRACRRSRRRGRPSSSAGRPTPRRRGGCCRSCRSRTSSSSRAPGTPPPASASPRCTSRGATRAASWRCSRRTTTSRARRRSARRSPARPQLAERGVDRDHRHPPVAARRPATGT